MARSGESGDEVNDTGPVIDGQSTSVHLLPADQLRQSVFLPDLLKTINLAYFTSESARPELGMATVDRLGSTEDLLATLAHDSEAFTIIVSRSRRTEVLGTASCRRYLEPSKHPTSPWVRRLPVGEDCIEWELKMMATHPTAQGQGLAGFMMKLAEQEVVRRIEASRQSSSPMSPCKKIKMVLCTPTEINGPFYARREYQKDYEVERGEGYNFHIVFMHKIIGTTCQG